MKDIFLSHSSLDKSEFVRPLAELLQSKGASIWLDENAIELGSNILEEIRTGISESLLFIIAISENSMTSNWANLELGLFLNKNSRCPILPIFYGIEHHTIAKKYPFLLDVKYLVYQNNIEHIAEQIIITLQNAKESSGFFNTHHTDLSALAKTIHEYNNIKLESVAIKLSKIKKELSRDFLCAIPLAIQVLEQITRDIADVENIYVQNNSEAFSIVIKSGILPLNLCEHIRFLSGLRRTFQSDIDKAESSYLMQLSLYSLVEYYIATYFKRPLFKHANTSVIWPSDIIDDDFDEIFNIENFYLPSELIASSETNRKWYNHNPYTIVGARQSETGKLIGFIHSLPLEESLYENFYSGNFDDTNLSITCIRQYDLEGLYKLYISSFCIHPKYQGNIYIFKSIFNAFIDMLLQLANEHNIFISDIIADGATLKGTSICENLGMDTCAISIHNTSVYHATLIPPNLASTRLDKHASKLLNYYRSKYEEYREIF